MCIPYSANHAAGVLARVCDLENEASPTSAIDRTSIAKAPTRRQKPENSVATTVDSEFTVFFSR